MLIHPYLFIYAPTEPTTSPTGIRVALREKTSVIVRWDRLQSFDIEAIESFLITLKIFKTFALQGTHIYQQYDRLIGPEVDINGLTPGTTYELTIAAVNSEGSGPLSLPFMFTTKQ